MTLVNQPTWKPNRKVWAAIIAGGIVGAIRTGSDLLWPGNPLEPLFEELGTWITSGIMVLFMYMAREKAND